MLTIVNKFDVAQYIPKPDGMNKAVTIIITVIIVGIIFIDGSSMFPVEFSLNEKKVVAPIIIIIIKYA